MITLKDMHEMFVLGSGRDTIEYLAFLTISDNVIVNCKQTDYKITIDLVINKSKDIKNFVAMKDYALIVVKEENGYIPTQVEINYKFYPSKVEVLGINLTRFRQAVIDYLSNKEKYTPDKFRIDANV